MAVAACRGARRRRGAGALPPPHIQSILVAQPERRERAHPRRRPRVATGPEARCCRDGARFCGACAGIGGRGQSAIYGRRPGTRVPWRASASGVCGPRAVTGAARGVCVCWHVWSSWLIGGRIESTESVVRLCVVVGRNTSPARAWGAQYRLGSCGMMALYRARPCVRCGRSATVGEQRRAPRHVNAAVPVGLHRRRCGPWTLPPGAAGRINPGRRAPASRAGAPRVWREHGHESGHSSHVSRLTRRDGRRDGASRRTGTRPVGVVGGSLRSA